MGFQGLGHNIFDMGCYPAHHKGLRKGLSLEGCSSNPEKESYLPKVSSKERGETDWLQKYFKGSVNITRRLIGCEECGRANVQIECTDFHVQSVTGRTIPSSIESEEQV